MNQSEVIEKVAQATELDQAAAGQAVTAVVNTILDALSAGEAVRVSGFGIFDVAARPARQGRNPRTGETIAIAASKAVRFHAGKAVKDAHPRRGLPGKRLHHQRNPWRGSNGLDLQGRIARVTRTVPLNSPKRPIRMRPWGSLRPTFGRPSPA
jgi:DNA-binding protein HU-beta